MGENECIEQRSIWTHRPDLQNINGTPKMKLIRNTISILATAATLAVSLSTAADASGPIAFQPAPDLAEYCQRYYGAELRLTKYSPLGWQCYKSPSQTWGISVGTACKNQYGLPKAAYRNKADPYSWYCTTAKPKPARVDLNRYCKKHFGTDARAKLLGSTTLDWVCAHGTHSRWGISVSTACKEQHGLPKASYTNRNDPNSWYCHR